MRPQISPSTSNIFLSPDEQSLCILDQSLLPNETRYLELRTEANSVEAISSLHVRGAPAIGIFAAFSMHILALRSKITGTAPFLKACALWRVALSAARPTAVNLSKMSNRMLKKAESMASAPVFRIVETLK